MEKNTIFEENKLRIKLFIKYYDKYCNKFLNVLKYPMFFFQKIQDRCEP